VTKAKISEYSATAGDNTDVNGTNIAEGCPPSGINDAIREVMAALKRFETGADGDSVTVGGNLVVSGSTTANTFTSTLINADNLSFDGNTISSTDTNGNIVLAPNGTGDVQVDADTLRVGDSGADATIQSNGNADLILKTGNATTGTVTLADGANGNLTVALNGTGQVVVNAGAAGTPTIAPTGDLNTGIFFPAADTIAFSEGGTEAMRIDSSGRVGIGSTSPAAKLDVVGASGTDTIRAAVIDSGTYQTSADFSNNVNANFQIRIKTSETSIGPSTATPLLFVNSSGTERMRITSGGFFKASNTGSYLNSSGTYHEFVNNGNDPAIYTSNPNASFSGVALLVQVTRNTTNNSFYPISYYNDGGSAYRFRVADSGNVTNTNGSYGTISDAKLKQDIVDAGSQWDDIKNLRFRKYRLKYEVELNPDAKPLLGLVAQEAELVSPGLIEEHRDTKQETKTREVEKTREVTPAALDEEGNVVEPAVTETYTETEEYTEIVDLRTTTKSIKTSVLYMKAVKALQEAMERIETLEAKVSALEAK
jgi:hypothetical protein